MNYDLFIPRSDDSNIKITLSPGETLFVLGANGTGKSSLMHRFYTNYPESARRISAHRQTWFNSNSNSMSAEQKRNALSYIMGTDMSLESRWKDFNATQRPNISIYDLVNAENVRARSIAGAIDRGDLDKARSISKESSPIRVINELLRLSNLPIEIFVREDGEVFATKDGSTQYSVAELSDGERNAVLIAADVLTIKEGTLVLIDEPERHLHRSIISPLLSLLFAKRPDCSFVVSTHDLLLPLDNREAQTLLVRRCTYAGTSVSSWDADVVPDSANLDEDLKKDILGARGRILFVEGVEQSLDKPLYSLVFPDVSIVTKESCRDVERAVIGIREAGDLHWVSAFGIVDNDRRPQEDIDQLKKKGIYAVSIYAVESIYYHPDIQRRVVERFASVTGEDAQEGLNSAKIAAIAAIAPNVQRLSERAVEKEIREEVFRRLPRRRDIADAKPVTISIDTSQYLAVETERFQDYLKSEDITTIIAQYPVRETAALSEISTKLGFKNRKQYESAVRTLLIDDTQALEFVRSLFGSLAADMDRGQ